MMKEYPKTCIYCGSPGPLSEEHVYGDWILEGGHLPRDANKHSLRVNILNPAGEPNKQHNLIKAGHPVGLKLRIVCEKCNNNWMSAIQSNAKQHLIHLFPGNKVWALGEASQAAIASWASMVSMTSEYQAFDLGRTAITQTERDSMRVNSSPPHGWRIWIGTCESRKWSGRWERTAAPILEAEEAARSSRPAPNTQATTFGVGNAYFHVMSGRFKEDVAAWNWANAPRARNLLAQIWPVQRRLITWPTERLTDTDANKFSAAFFERFIDLVRAKRK